MSDSAVSTEKLTSLLLENVLDYAIFMISLQGTILTWTRSIERLLGYNESEFVGQPAEQIFTPEDRSDNVPAREFVLAREQGRAEDVRWHLHKNGTRFWANGQMIALRNEAGDLQGYAKILRDETARKLTEIELEAKLEEVTRRLQSALDAGRIGTWRWDIKNDRVFADVNLARFFGVSPEVAAGGPIEHYTRAMHPEDVGQVIGAINESIETDRAFAEDYRLVHGDGTTIWVEARGKIEKDEQGTPFRLDGVVLDITQRKQIEEALGHSEDRYRRLFNSIDAGFCVIRVLFNDAGRPSDYRFLELNPAFEQQTGLVDAIGKTARELVPGLDQSWYDIYGKVALTGEPMRFENNAEAMNRWFEVYAFRFGKPESHKVAILFNDITSRKRGENALRQAHEKSEETNRIKDEFLATLSHELRTPLNAILGWSNLLRSNQLDEETQKSGLEVIERNARAQAQLIEDLLDVSRILTGKMRLELQTLNLGEVLQEAVTTAAPTAGAKYIQLHTEIDHSTGLIAGDAHRLRQVFWNLLSNAIKFTPKQGHIWVRMGLVESQVRVQITDTGKGIPADFLPYMFERFRQADASSTRAHGGLGIGLGLVKHLVEAHGGTVSATSPGENQGSTFVVKFPLVSVHTGHSPTPLVADETDEESEADESASPLPSDTSPLLKDLRILVVDDEPDARELTAFTLRQHGARVEVANSATVALAFIVDSQQAGKPFEILVSDVGMPEEDGYNLVRRIRALEAPKHPLLPAVALTAYASPKDRMKALLAGFQAHISKPVDASELVATVASLVGRTGHEG